METQPRPPENERYKRPPSFSTENVIRAATGWQEPNKPRILPDAKVESFDQELSPQDLEEDVQELPQESIEIISREEALAEQKRRDEEILAKLN